MIRVRDLTKRYAGHLAVDRISFDVERGRIVGFLGLNGAGKTSTMRILACFHPPTSGTAEVAGCDVMTRSFEVRRNVGYLPESVPLYTDMRVSEYLDYRARLKGVPPGLRRRRIDTVVERCGLGSVRRRIVGQLSKGYRQRVGLADAMVHDPPLLILDEPTIGLDPHQIRTIRQLIRELGRDHTVMLSTHILHEVEMVCDQAIIINRGRIAAVEWLKDLGRVYTRLEVRAPLEEARQAVRGVPGVTGVEGAPAGADGLLSLRVDAADGRDVREDLFRLAVQKGWTVRDLSQQRQSLEEIFLKVTGGEDGPAEAPASAAPEPAAAKAG